MRTAGKMFQKNLLTRDECLQFEAKMREKYRPVIGILFSDIDLLLCG
ncbi:SHOCT domain-containing protein [Selenomonas sputigena]